MKGSDTPAPTTASRRERPSEDPGPVTLSVGAVSRAPDDFLRALEKAHDQAPESFGPLAAGGMGMIDIVHDPVLRRRSARKRVHPHLQDDVETLRRFVREAQVTGQLDHPNIVPVRQLAFDDQGQLYFTMKLVGGRTLSAILKSLDHPLSHHAIFEVLDIIVKVCDALAFAHSRGVIHCDIKPANIMVGEFGEVYLMDWGVAIVRSERSGAAEVLPREAGEEAPTLAGTPTHMSPEQARGDTDAIDERSDVFAVGALIYQALTRRAPFSGDTFWASVLRAQMGSYTPIEDAAGAGVVPRALIDLVDRAMAKDPSTRFDDVRALKEAILQFVRGGAPFPRRTFMAGDAIVTEGEMGDRAYRIRAGTCVVTKDGKEIRRMEAGEVFGEMSILSPGPRTASVRAETNVVCEVVTAEVFESELDAMKPWMSAFIRTLADRFRETGR